VEKYAEVLLTSELTPGLLPPAFGSLAEDITAAVMSEVEEYAQPGDEEAARAVRRVARDAVAGFAARLTGQAASPAAGQPATGQPETGRPEAGPPEAASAAGMFRDLGRLLAIEGRSLGALHAALRVGARVTWHRLQEQARAGNGNPETFTRVGETVFWYLDELTASCSAGMPRHGPNSPGRPANCGGACSTCSRRATRRRLRRSRAWPGRPDGRCPGGSPRWRSLRWPCLRWLGGPARRPACSPT
jgi:hypothetical protein